MEVADKAGMTHSGYKVIEEGFIQHIEPDSAMAAQELYDLVLQAPYVSQQKKMELTAGYTFEDDNDEAHCLILRECVCDDTFRG